MTKKELHEAIEADLFRYKGKISSLLFWKNFLFLPNFRATVFYRYCRYYKGKNKLFELFFRLLMRGMMFKYGVGITHTSQIGKGLFVAHCGCIFFNSEIVMGDNCDIRHGVTIGAIYRGSKVGCPTIGNKVWIGSHAVIVGKIKVGNNVLIGPGAFVNFDVPDNAVVIGNPGKIVSYGGTDGYINNVFELEK